MKPEEKAARAFDDIIAKHPEEYRDNKEKGLLYEALVASYREYESFKGKEFADD